MATAPLHPKNDKIDIWNALLDEICEVAPITIVQKVLKAGANITLVPDGLGGLTVNATGALSSVVVDGVTITGAGTVGSPLVAHITGSASVYADGVTITGNGTAGNPLVAHFPSYTSPDAGQIGALAIGVNLNTWSGPATGGLWVGARHDNIIFSGSGGFIYYFGGAWVPMSCVTDFFVLVKRVA